MAGKGTYYLGRVIKTGNLSSKDIERAIQAPRSVDRYGSAWTFLDVQPFSDRAVPYIFGRLAKYDPKAEVPVVDPARHEEVWRPEPNMTKAASPFVYIPEYAGVAFLHVSNKLEYKAFLNRWSEIVNASHAQLLAQCDIDPITDLRTFAKKLQSLDGIYRVSGKVRPPNPLFGPLWESLKEYLSGRNTDKMSVQEESAADEPLNSQLPEHVQGILDQTQDQPYRPDWVPIGDAAILMAADGYGTGHVRGRRDGDFIIIRTSETVRNFAFSRDPEPEELFEKAYEIFRQIEVERHMEH